MLDFTQILKGISEVGFPIVVCLFLLFKIIPRMDELIRISCAIYRHITGNDWNSDPTDNKRGGKKLWFRK